MIEVIDIILTVLCVGCIVVTAACIVHKNLSSRCVPRQRYTPIHHRSIK